MKFTHKIDEWFSKRSGVYFYLVSLVLVLFYLSNKFYPIFVENYFIKIDLWIAINVPILSPWFEIIQESYSEFVSEQDRKFVTNFIEWFGVLYGFLLPLILVRVWEQFDTIEREFDREADTIKVLYEDILLLDDKKYLNFKHDTLIALRNYLDHVIEHFSNEHRRSQVKLKVKGDNLLRMVRKNYDKLLHPSKKSDSESSALVSELIRQLDSAIDTRGDRISLLRERLFQGLRSVSFLTSIIWLTPFYFLEFRTAVFGDFLILTITFLVIFILSTIEDLDEPFHGFWKIEIETWKQLNSEIDETISNIR